MDSHCSLPLVKLVPAKLVPAKAGSREWGWEWYAEAKVKNDKKVQVG